MELFCPSKGCSHKWLDCESRDSKRDLCLSIVPRSVLQRVWGTYTAKGNTNAPKRPKRASLDIADAIFFFPVVFCHECTQSTNGTIGPRFGGQDEESDRKAVDGDGVVIFAGGW